MNLFFCKSLSGPYLGPGLHASDLTRAEKTYTVNVNANAIVVYSGSVPRCFLYFLFVICRIFGSWSGFCHN